MPRKVIIKDDRRAEGRYSLYIEGAPNGAWYTGLTFADRRKAERVARLINESIE